LVLWFYRQGMLNQLKTLRGFLPIVILSFASLAWGDTVRLEELPLDQIRQDFGQPQIDKSVERHPLSIGGKSFEHGLGTHAYSVWWLNLGATAERLTASVGLDDDVKTNPASARARIDFKLIGDHKTLYQSGPMKAGDAAKVVDVDLHGIKTLLLIVSSASRSVDFLHADWAEGQITYTGQRPQPMAAPAEPAEVLTPKPAATPRLNGAAVVGVRPGHPLLFHVAATGDRPMVFSADGLPEGFSLDAKTGQITGSSTQPGTSVVKFTATNASGSNQRDLRIVVGDQIALTPPMGWNSWNCFAQAVSDEKVRAAADAMVKSGLIDHGWTYINVDDCWEVRANRPADERRDMDGNIKTNAKFPDMKAMADYIHSKGLRAGLYSSPGPSTCGGFTASYKFEEKDAAQYAAWGFDYLKYDWCSYGGIASQIRKSATRPTELEIFQQPYIVMRDALAKQNRDILFSFCQYGMGNVWQWGEKTGGNCWRTTGDINDSWGSMSNIGFNQNGHEKYAGPGHWNDPDMLVVGKVGWGPALHPTHLTPNEQYTHISLWSLLAAPMLIGCDMTQMDDFTLGLLTNDEVIAVNQDALGQQAKRVATGGEDMEVWARDLQDGTKAVGLFNRGDMPVSISAKWSDLGISGKQVVRDLWRQKDLGEFGDQFSAEVGRHGVILIKVSQPKS
jgi:alpha-galactosidase